MVQIDQGGQWPASEMQKLRPGEWKETMEKGLRVVENSLPNLVQDLEIGQTTYDKKRNVIFAKMRSEVVGVGKVLALTAVILSNYGAVTLYCYSTENSFDDDLDYFNQIIDSFRFDIGYEYSQVTENDYTTKIDSSGSLLWKPSKNSPRCVYCWCFGNSSNHNHCKKVGEGCEAGYC